MRGMRWHGTVCLLISMLIAVFVSSAPTVAAEDSVVCGYTDFRGRCTLLVEVPGNYESAEEQGTTRTVRSGPQKCTRPGGTEVDCTSDSGTWHAGRMCYVRAQTPAPPFTDAAWAGNTDGVVMRCTSAGNVVALYWQASAEAAAAAIPDPARLAQMAVETMDLNPIELGTFPLTTQNAPDHLGYVGWNAWLWAEGVDENMWGPITRSASEAGYTVTATATVSEVVWDMGNGDTVTCDQGTPWRESVSRNEPSPDCGYVYTRDGEYTIAATTFWNIEWSGIGSSGTIEMDLTRSGDVRIAEVQVVNVAPTDN